jgi:PAS domain-containing protein
MIHKDDDKPTLKSVTSIESLGWSTLENLYSLFTKLSTPIHLFLAAVGLVIAIYYGKELVRSLLNNQRSVALALAAKVEPTRNPDQGITSILLSNVKDEWTKPEHLNIPDLKSILDEIEKKVADVAQAQIEEEAARANQGRTANKNVSAANATQVAPSAAQGLIKKLNLTVIHRGSIAPWQTAILSKRKESFMVVPAMSLRRKTLNELPLETTADDQSPLATALEYNPEIKFDLYLCLELEPIMRKIDNSSAERLAVIQTYVITESGVFLIRANGVKDQGDYYGDEFQPYTQYMDRPYFWGAVELRERKTPPFDYGTKPYLDLGGNGFVVTFSKKFMLPNQRVGVLCVDAKLPDDITDEIQKYMKSLGASVSDFYWSKNMSIEPGSDGRALPPGFEWFNVQINKSLDARSRVLGNIATEPAKISPAQSQSEVGSTVRFTVPVSSTEYGDGNKRTRLLWVEFNSASILKTLFTNLMLFTAGSILVIAVAWSLFWDYTVLKREMSNVLKKMSRVMRNASTPFVWLDEKNEFVKVNKSMLDLLGHENIEELKKQSTTFKGLLTDDSQLIYEDILKSSSAGIEKGEYEIEVITSKHEVLRVRAHGERIPYPTLWRRGLPHRFGIIVEVINPAAMAESEPNTSQPDLPKVRSIHA